MSNSTTHLTSKLKKKTEKLKKTMRHRKGDSKGYLMEDFLVGGGRGTEENDLRSPTPLHLVLPTLKDTFLLSNAESRP